MPTDPSPEAVEQVVVPAPLGAALVPRAVVAVEVGLVPQAVALELVPLAAEAGLVLVPQAVVAVAAAPARSSS